MANDKGVDFRITADGSQAESEFNKLGDSAERASGHVSSAWADCAKRMRDQWRAAHYDMEMASREKVGQIKTNFKELDDVFARINKMLGAVTLGMMAGMSAKHVVDVASTFEQLEIRLNSVMGSAKAGEEAFAWIKQFAQNTPYSVQQTTDAFMTLKNFGLDPMDGTLQKIADASAKYGSSAESAKSVSLALGQAWARGKLQGQDTLQMIDAGIPVYDLLAKATGKTAAEIQKMSEAGTMGRDVMRKLIDQMGQEGAGTAAAKMNSFAGAVSNMGDAFENSIDRLRKQGGFAFLTQGVLRFTELLPGMVAAAGDACAVVGDVMKALWSVVSDVFSSIGSVLNAVFGSGGEGMSAMQFFANSIKVVEVALIGFRVGFAAVFEFIKMMLAQGAAYFGGFALAANRALMLDFAGAQAAWKKGVADSGVIFGEGMKNIASIAEKGRADIDKAIMGDGPVNIVADHKVNDKKVQSDPGKSQMAEWKSALEQKHEVEGNFFKSSLADDEAFWQAKLAHVKKGSADERAIRHELFAIHKQQATDKFASEMDALKAEEAAAKAGSERRIELAGQVAKRIGETYGWESKEYAASIKDITKAAEEFDKEQQKLETMRIDRARDHAIAQQGLERDHLALLKNLGQISDQEEIAALKALEENKYQVEVQALQDKIALMKEEGAARQQQLDELAKMKEQHDAAMVKLEDQRILAVKKDWDSMLGAVSGAFEQSLNGMIQGTQTFQKSMANIQQAILAEFIKMGVKKVTSEIANQAAMTAASTTGAAVRGAAEKGASGQSLMLNAMQAIKKIINAAGETFAGTFAFLSPEMGPMAAGPAMAASGAVAAVAGTVASSAGGEWRVPADRLNLVHKNETILPAHIATPLRNMVEGGGMGGGDTINIHAMDARSFQRFLSDNSAALPPAMQRLARQFVKVK